MPSINDMKVDKESGLFKCSCGSTDLKVYEDYYWDADIEKQEDGKLHVSCYKAESEIGKLFCNECGEEITDAIHEENIEWDFN